MDWEASRGWGRPGGDERSQSKVRRHQIGHRARSIVPLLLGALRHHPGEGGEARKAKQPRSQPQAVESAPRQGQEGPSPLLAERSCERHGGTRRQPHCIEKGTPGKVQVHGEIGLLLPGVSWHLPTPSWRCRRCPSSSPSQHVRVLHAEAAPATAGLGGLGGHGREQGVRGQGQHRVLHQHQVQLLLG